MQLNSLRYRKFDLILALGIVCLLWGPSVSVFSNQTVAASAVEAERVIEPDSRGESPCRITRFPNPEASFLADDGLATVVVDITGYSSSVDQTDDSPNITAANTRVRPGIIALSRDLLKEFTPDAPFSFHDKLEIPGVGRFVVEDTMHPRWTHKADIWYAKRSDAIRWGRRTHRIYRLPDEADLRLPLPGPAEVAATFGQANFQ